MKTKIKSIVGLGLLIIVFIASCKKEDDSGHIPDNGYRGGIYIVNEGPFLTGTGTVDFLGRNMSKSENIYPASNGGQLLGNLVQSIAVIATQTYIVVNNDDKVVIVDSKTFQKTGIFENLPSPRYIIEADADNAFVSCWGDSSVKIVNLYSYEVIGSIPVKGPEKMMKINSEVWVLSQGGWSVDSTITVIDIASKSVKQTIQVYPQPSGIQQDKNGNIWVMCSGRNSWHPGGNSKGYLVCINPLDYSIVKDIEFPSFENHPEELVINGTKDILYYRYPGGIYKIGIEATDPENVPFIARASGFYTIAYDYVDNFIFGSDPLDYVQNGWVFRYNADSGAAVDSTEAGIIPGEIYIMPMPVF